jgi:iron complex transport system substrate-binding protein
MRRRTLMAGAAVIAAGATSACGASSTRGRDAGSTSSDGGDADAFPLTLDHALGTCSLDRAPQRVVTLGAADAQIASALGAEIVGASMDDASEDGSWPGMATPFAQGTTRLDGLEPDMEEIAGLAPDLILATTSQPSVYERYDRLAAVAPVLAYATAPLQDTGEQLTSAIGRALGRTAQAEELTSASASAIEGFLAQHPEVEGRSYVFGQISDADYFVVGERAQSVRFMAQLGMTVPASLAALWDESDTGYASSLGMITLSVEQLDRIDAADIALVSAFGDDADEAFLQSPLIASSSLVEEDRLHMIEQDLAAALLQPNPATTPFLLEHLTPLLTSAFAS